MLQLTRNRYFIIFFIIYWAAVAVLSIRFNTPLRDSMELLIVFGLLLPFVAWLSTKNINPPLAEKGPLKTEVILLGALILFVTWYITYGTTMINKLMPADILQSEWKKSMVIFIKKLVVFVMLPFFLYKTAGFSLKDFGFLTGRRTLLSKKTFFTFIVLSVLILLYQYFFSGGAKPLRDGQFTVQQLIIGLPLVLVWLFIETGLIEEFFFRAVLQSRITAVLKSPVAGIVISGLIFGLAHAPGLYLRGAESEGISEQMPFIFWACFTISAMSLAGIFLGIVWQRTKNIYLVMALHAMVDLLPNFGRIIHAWNL